MDSHRRLRMNFMHAPTSHSISTLSIPLARATFSLTDLHRTPTRTTPRAFSRLFANPSSVPALTSSKRARHPSNHVAVSVRHTTLPHLVTLTFSGPTTTSIMTNPVELGMRGMRAIESVGMKVPFCILCVTTDREFAQRPLAVVLFLTDLIYTDF